MKPGEQWMTHVVLRSKFGGPRNNEFLWAEIVSLEERLKLCKAGQAFEWKDQEGKTHAFLQQESYPSFSAAKQAWKEVCKHYKEINRRTMYSWEPRKTLNAVIPEIQLNANYVVSD